jgi:hypothetical protein
MSEIKGSKGRGHPQRKAKKYFKLIESELSTLKHSSPQLYDADSLY